jgi:hypothetical protein
MARPARPEPKVFLSPEVVARGRQWYEATYFAHTTTESLLGEKSTSYLEDADAAGRARAVLGSADIVVSLRDPVERAVSNWRFSRANGLEQRPLERALADNLTGTTDWDRSATSVSPYAYLERGRYADYLLPWLDAFPPASVHVRFVEEQRDPAGTLRQLYAALGVDPGVVALNRHPRERRSDGPTPGLSRELRSRLRAYFRPADERLRELLGRELPWSSG